MPGETTATYGHCAAAVEAIMNGTAFNNAKGYEEYKDNRFSIQEIHLSIDNYAAVKKSGCINKLLYLSQFIYNQYARNCRGK